MKYLLRILALPFVFGVVLIKCFYLSLRETWLFLSFGGEIFIHRDENHYTAVKDILEHLKEEQKEREAEKEYLKEYPPFGAPYDK